MAPIDKPSRAPPHLGVHGRWSKRPQRGWIKLARKTRFGWIKLGRISPSEWIKLVRISPPKVDQAGENRWIMLVRNDKQSEQRLPGYILPLASGLRRAVLFTLSLGV
jgi:hypothetical protein